jgi:hypothetical protein
VKHKKVIRRRRICAAAFIHSFMFGTPMNLGNVRLRRSGIRRYETKAYKREMARTLRQCADAANLIFCEASPQ